MTSQKAFFAITLALVGLAGWQSLAQDAPFESADQAGDALRAATRALAEARQRGDALEDAARRATAAADRTASEAAAVAARIQQSEAEILLAQAQIAAIDRQRAALRLRIAARQEPVVRLTAALQLMSRRPLVFSLMRADTLRETVYLRAVLETMLPEVQRRTAGLRSEIERGRQLQDRARRAARDLKASEQALDQRRQQLAALESRQRIASRSAQGIASREADRALALAEDARDITALIERLRADGALRSQLAALPGPVPRPDRPGSLLVIDEAAPAQISGAGLSWIMPVSGRIISGFGDAVGSARAMGVTLAPAAGAQVIAPAAGRVAFAGDYRGYGRIVIIDHDGGWTSLVTNLGRLNVAVTARVVQGSPIGLAGPGRPTVTIELRKDGTPVNPLALAVP
ncbi:peptidoglycan DD-metalloendopeptidase family protein [Novosphingobium sp. PASSN1]|uniref:murein hydrolase activator EnvC family protein n=1 Tax=Novosphingobium sp. PASSN1 TaxID=2015561 RepID=UPI000BD4F775|nr:peptidoglycan DD-metalloendopeptidase family protein [Novosphingobium sp. PASSN1]OYU36808.1 MAG: metalloendopeptidase [Novosphingobium sp. PASSN1]